MVFILVDFTDGIGRTRKIGYDVRSGDWEMVCILLHIFVIYFCKFIEFFCYFYKIILFVVNL